MLRRLREATFGSFRKLREQKSVSTNEQPSKYNDKYERFLRRLITQIANYAESGPTFDPSGKYLCGTCNQRNGDNTVRVPCASVSGLISLTTGGCSYYVRGSAIGAKLGFTRKDSQKRARYGERPKSKGFGCARCGYAEKANKPDSQGRTLWCKRWGKGLHVMPKACCAEEEGPDLVEAPGQKKNST